MDLGKIGYRVGINDSEYRATLDGMKSQAQNIGATLKNIFGNLAAFAGIAQLFRVALGGAKSLQQELANISSIAPELNMDKMKDALVGLDSKFGDSAALANAAFFAWSSGVRGTEKEIADFTGQIAKLAKTVGSEATPIMDAVTTLMNSYGMKTQDAGKISDWFFQIIKSGKTTGSELAMHLGQIVSTASAAKMPLNQLGAALATLTTIMPTAEATTALNQAILTFINPTADAAQAAKSYGIELSAAELESKGFLGMIEEIKAKTGGNVEVMTQLFGSVRALKAALALSGDQLGQFSGIMKEFENNAGAAEQAANKILGTDPAKIEGLITAGKKILEVVGNIIYQVLTLGGLLNPFYEWVSKLNGRTIEIIGKLVAFAAGLLLVRKAIKGLSALKGVYENLAVKFSATKAQQVRDAKFAAEAEIMEEQRKNAVLTTLNARLAVQEKQIALDKVRNSQNASATAIALAQNEVTVAENKYRTERANMLRLKQDNAALFAWTSQKRFQVRAQEEANATRSLLFAKKSALARMQYSKKASDFEIANLQKEIRFLDAKYQAQMKNAKGAMPASKGGGLAGFLPGGKFGRGMMIASGTSMAAGFIADGLASSARSSGHEEAADTLNTVGTVAQSAGTLAMVMPYLAKLKPALMAVKTFAVSAAGLATGAGLLAAGAIFGGTALLWRSATSKYRKEAEIAHKEYEAAHKKWQEAVKNVEKQRKKLDQAKEEESQAETLGARLGWLAKQQKLSNEEMKEAENLTALLTERYGEFFYTIDHSRNKLTTIENPDVYFDKKARAKTGKEADNMKAGIEAEIAEAKSAKEERENEIRKNEFAKNSNWYAAADDYTKEQALQRAYRRDKAWNAANNRANSAISERDKTAKDEVFAKANAEGVKNATLDRMRAENAELEKRLKLTRSLIHQENGELSWLDQRILLEEKIVKLKKKQKEFADKAYSADLKGDTLGFEKSRSDVLKMKQAVAEAQNEIAFGDKAEKKKEREKRIEDFSKSASEEQARMLGNYDQFTGQYKAKVSDNDRLEAAKKRIENENSLMKMYQEAEAEAGSTEDSERYRSERLRHQDAYFKAQRDVQTIEQSILDRKDHEAETARETAYLDAETAALKDGEIDEKEDLALKNLKIQQQRERVAELEKRIAGGREEGITGENKKSLADARRQLAGLISDKTKAENKRDSNRPAEIGSFSAAMLKLGGPQAEDTEKIRIREGVEKIVSNTKKPMKFGK